MIDAAMAAPDQETLVRTFKEMDNYIIGQVYNLVLPRGPSYALFQRHAVHHHRQADAGKQRQGARPGSTAARPAPSRASGGHGHDAQEHPAQGQTRDVSAAGAVGTQIGAIGAV